MTETEEDILKRFVADMPLRSSGLPWETRVGSPIHALLTPGAQERLRMLDFSRDAFSGCFLFWAEGTSLDAKAAEFGITRSVATKATTTVTFTGTEGTIIPIGTRIATVGDATSGIPGVVFVTLAQGTISLGVATVAVQTEEAGVDGNVDVGTITFILSSVDGLSSVSNPTAGSGGSDDEDDETLRARSVARAQAQPAGGNKGTYIALALEEAEAGTVYVEDLWNTVGPNQASKSGVGSGRVVVGGTKLPYVSPATIDRLQDMIDPSVQVCAHFEGTESFAQTSGVAGTGVAETAAPIEGAGSWRLTPGTSATTEIAWTLPAALNLSRFSAVDDEVWLEYKQAAAQATISLVRVILESATGTNIAHIDATGTEIPHPSGRIVMQRQDFVVDAGSLDALLGAVSKIKVQVTATASGATDVTVDGLRLARLKGGLGDGAANLGVQIAVRSARQSLFDVTATVVLDSGVVVNAVAGAVREDINRYLETLRPGSVLRVTQIANLVHDAIGVVDYSVVQIGRSGQALGTANITLAADERPALKDLTLST